MHPKCIKAGKGNQIHPSVTVNSCLPVKFLIYWLPKTEQIFFKLLWQKNIYI